MTRRVGLFGAVVGMALAATAVGEDCASAVCRAHQAWWTGEPDAAAAARKIEAELERTPA